MTVQLIEMVQYRIQRSRHSKKDLLHSLPTRESLSLRQDTDTDIHTPRRSAFLNAWVVETQMVIARGMRRYQCSGWGRENINGRSRGIIDHVGKGSDSGLWKAGLHRTLRVWVGVGDPLKLEQ